MSDNPVITVDGPAASGKGTLASRLSEALGFHLLDSGLLYRIVAFVASEADVDLSAGQPLHELVGDRMVFKVNQKPERRASEGIYAIYINTVIGLRDYVTINDHNLSATLRSMDISRDASLVAAVPEVREQLIPIQRSFRQPPGLVADGRDMGTVVFPDAPVKFYLDASVEIRAERRYRELGGSNGERDLKDIQAELVQRDQRDEMRAVAPLTIAKDAVTIDSTNLSIDEMVNVAVEETRKTLDSESKWH